MLKLSEAIRLGAMLKPQAFGKAFVFVKFGELGSCALGAAEDAINGPIYEASDGGAKQLEVYERYSLNKQRRDCPSCDRPGRLSDVIVHLNDDHQWTRERIADWVETIEPAQVESVRPHADQNDVSLGVHAKPIVDEKQLA